MTLSGHTGSVTKWQSSATSNFSSPTDINNTTTSLTALNLSSDRYYRAVITSGVCSSANSASALITVDPAAVGGTISGGASVCTGTNSTLLTLSGNTGSVTKWQSSTNGGSSWSDISNTSSTYTATNLTTTTLYRAVITSGSCSTTANSASATVTVNALPQGSLTGNGTICPNSAANLTWTATSGTGPYSVVYNNGTSNSTQNSVTSGTAFTANASLGSNTTYTLVSVTDNNGCVRSSSFTGSSASITVRSLPSWANLQYPGTATICGSTVSVYGKVYGSGITEANGANSNITADLGYSSSNTNPNTWSNWISASYNTQSGNDDEYVAQLGSGLTTGTWYYAYRYSYYGCDYIYGGTAGVWSNDNGVATVPTSQTITLSSSAGTNAQSFCKGTSLTNITYTLGSGANNATVSGLPAGVSYSVSGTTLTISGTPTGSGVSNYTVTTSGTSNCPVIAAGSITVNETLDWANLQSPASGTICSDGTFDIFGRVYEPSVTTPGGAPSGITVQAGYSTTNNNPSNWTNWSSATYNAQYGNDDEFQYTFSGLSAGTYYYTLKYSYNGCVIYGGYNTGNWDGSTNVSGVLTVNSNNTAGTASSTPTLCINTALTNITHATTGATGIGTASGLPTGVSASWASNTITISGTPTVAGTYNYTIPLSGGCGSVNATGTIIVSAANTASLPSTTPTLCANSTLTDITHTTTGATGIGTASGLPTGVSAAWASNVITISGTPTTAGTYNYSIPLSGGCGSVNATGTITVTASNTAAAASSSPTLCINTVLTNITHVTTGATGISSSGVSGANSLPAGVSASWSSNTITISGTPTASGTFNYSIPLTGGCGSVSATGTIIVSPLTVAGSISGSTAVCSGTNSTVLTLSGHTGSITKWQCSASSDFSSSTDISNTSTTYTATNLTSTTYYRAVITSGACSAANSSTATITVDPVSAGGSISPSSTSVCSGTNSTALTLSGNTGSVTKWQSSTASDFSSAVTDISNTTTSLTATNLTATTYYRAVVTSGSCSAANSSSATITVNPNLAASASIASSDGDNTICSGVSVTFTATPTNGGTPSYQWKLNDVNVGTNSTTYTNTGLANGDVVKVVMTSNATCATGSPATSNSITTTVNANPTATAGSALSAICQSATSAAMGGSVGGGATGGTWTGGAGTWASATDPNAATYTAGASETGSITLTLTTSGGSCGTTTTTKSITINQNPTVSAGSALSAICQSATSAAMGGSVGGGATGGTWSGGAGIWTNPTNPSTATYTAGASESGTITLTLTTSGGSCSTTTTTKTITVNAKPTADAGTNFTTCTGVANEIGNALGASGGTSPYTYSWSPTSNLSSSSIANPVATVTSTTTYTLTVTDANSCTSTSSIVITIGSGTTKYWAGTGSSIANTNAKTTNLNTATNWSSSSSSYVTTSIPGSCDNTVISISTAGSVLLMSGNLSVKDFTYTNTDNTGSAVDPSSYTLTINGNASIDATGGNGSINYFGNYNTTNNGTIIIKGNLTLDNTGTRSSYLVGNTNTTFKFLGNVTFGTTGDVFATYRPAYLVFDGLTTQTFTINNTSPSILSRTNLTIGESNTPSVTMAGSFTTAQVLGNLTISANCTLDLSSKQLNRSAAGGTLSLGAGATLKIGGTNTFPTNYSTNTLNATSTVEYNGTTQTVSGTPTYGNLTITNAGTKTAGAALTVASNFTINSGSTFAGGTAFTHNVAGNWTNNGGTFTVGTSTINFNSTAANQAINGTAASQTFNNITVNKTGRTLSVGGSTTSLTAAAFTITVGTFTAPTTLNISGNFANSGTFTHNSGTATFNGGAAQTLNSGGSSFNNLSITNSSGGVSLSTNNLTVAGTFTLNGAGGFSANLLTNTVTGAATLTSGIYTASTAAQTFNGGLTVNGGTLTGSSGTITTTSLTQSSGTITAPGSTGTFNVSGDWTRSGGNFDNSTGTVTFNGNNALQTISGSATTGFNKITVDKGTAKTNILDVTGVITMATATGTGTSLAITNGSFRLSSASTITPFGGNTSIPATGGFILNNSSATANWGSAGSLTLNGDLNIINGTMSVGTGNNTLLIGATGNYTQSGGTMNVRGRMQGTTSGGSFTLSAGNFNIPTGGSVNASGNSIFQATGLSTFSVSGGTITIASANSNTTLPDINITTGTISAGTFVVSDATVTVNSSIPFYNLTVQNGSGTAIARLRGNVSVTNNLTLTSGTYDANTYTSTITNLVTVPTGATYLASSATQTLSAGLTVSGGTFTGAAGTVTTTNVTLSLGTLTAPSGTFNISGNWSRSGSPTFNHNNGTVVFNGTDQSITGSNAFYSFNKTVTSGATLTLPSSATQTFAVGGTLTLQGAANNLLTIVSSTPGTQASINPSGTRVIDFVNVKDNNNANATVITATNSYDAGNLTNWAFSAANLVWTGATNTNWNTSSNWAAGYLPNATDNVTITKTGSNNLVLETSPTVNNITISANNTVSLGSNTLTVKGTWLNNGTLTPGTSTVSFAGTTGTQTVNNGANSFYNVTHTGASTLQALTNAMTIGGTFTNSAGTFDANSLGNTFTGAITVSGGTLNASSATQTFTGAVTLSGGTYTAGSNSQTFNGGLTVSGGTFTGSSGAVTTTNLTISSGTFTAPSTTLNVSGNFSNSGTFTHNSGTVVFNGITQSVTGATTFNNLTHSGASAQTLTINTATTVNGNVTNSDGTLALNNVNLTIGGNYSNSVGSGFTPGSGSVIFNNASATQTLLMTTGGDFSNIQHTGAGTLQLSSDLAMTGNLTNSAGTFDVNGYNIVIGGNWTNSAAFLPGTGATYVALNGSSGTQTIDNGSSQFNDLQVIGTAAVTMTTPAQSFGNVTVNGPLSSTAQLVLVGGDAQSITSTYYTGGTAIPFQNLTINKTAGAAVTLTKPVRVTGTLTMTQGDIITDATNILEVGSSASSIGSITWTAGTVRGPLKRWFNSSANSTQESGIFPVGVASGAKAGTNRYAQVNFTSNPGTGGYIIAEYKSGTPPTSPTGLPLNYSSGSYPQAIQNFEEEGYWDITPYNSASTAYAALNSTPYTLKLRLQNPSTLTTGWTPSNDGNDLYNASTIRLIRAKGSNNHANWELAGTHVSATETGNGDYFITSSGITEFSWFNGGGNNQNPLPVELVSFSGACDNGVISLTWQTASEFNSSHFDVEKSRDGENWQVLTTMPSAGTSNELITYQSTDQNGTEGNNYFRLRQVDVDGTEKLYDPINVSCSEVTTGYFSSFPNPSGSAFQVILNNKELIGTCTMNVVDASGKVVEVKEIDVKEGINMFVINQELTPGIYFLNVSNGVKSTPVLRHAIK